MAQRPIRLINSSNEPSYNDVGNETYDSCIDNVQKPLEENNLGMKIGPEAYQESANEMDSTIENNVTENGDNLGSSGSGSSETAGGSPQNSLSTGYGSEDSITTGPQTAAVLAAIAGAVATVATNWFMNIFTPGLKKGDCALQCKSFNNASYSQLIAVGTDGLPCFTVC